MPTPSSLATRVAHRVSREPVLLELDLSRGLLETAPSDPVSALRSRGIPTLRGLVDRLHRACEDPQVVGLVGHVGAEALSPSQADELAAAVEDFAATGRRTAAYAETFGELGGGTTAYRLAVAFDTIWMQPSGRLGLTGVALRGVFVRGLLDRLGIEPQIGQRHEYKGAADTLLREQMSGPQRESLQQVADSVLESLVTTTARRRRRSPDEVRAAVDAAPLGADQAVRAGLVDRLGYRDEVYADLRAQLGQDGRLALRYVHRWTPARSTTVARQVRHVRHPRARRRPTVAVVSVLGGIGLGRGGSSPLGGPRAGSDTVGAALREAARDEGVRAVVLRVVSPGGSYVASDAIRRQVLALRETGRPVVASMGTVAASGGYFVAMGCDEVLATPSTLTGSIGVLGGKLVVGAALARVGVGVDTVGAGRQARMFDPDTPFDADQWRRVNEWLDEVYADFTSKAAVDRGMSQGDLEPLARGRVWTGADARDRGLVDDLGGLRAAVGRAARRAGLDPDRVRVRALPHVRPTDRLRPAQSSEHATATVPGAALAGGGLEQLAARVGLAPAGVLTLPWAWELGPTA